MAMRNSIIYHLTTVHPWNDNRIYEKMVKGLAARRWRVVYIAPLAKNKPPFELNITFVPLPARNDLVGRIARLLKAFFFLQSQAPSILHFHDPEILLIAWILRRKGWRIVYDVHEDYTLAIQVKHYIPNLFKPIARFLINHIEDRASRAFDLVLAERAYQKRFPKGRLVLNYPNEPSFDRTVSKLEPTTVPPRILYTGTVSEERGALLFAPLLRALASLELHVIGRCDEDLRRRILSSAVDVRDRLIFRADENGVPHSRIIEEYKKHDWAFGIAVFPYTDHYAEKELTKFFEYISYGIPILCSNFPAWIRLIDANHIGITIAPDNLFEDCERKVKPVISDFFLWKSLRDRCKSLAKRYTWDSQLSILEDLYNEILSRQT
ncbi:MAG: glycosyltransferase WbpH [Nitrospiraceae bacterium]|nr:MAG: glycosyltransferase WbpH [Nitrospiraceae bacterium]